MTALRVVPDAPVPFHQKSRADQLAQQKQAYDQMAGAGEESDRARFEALAAEKAAQLLWEWQRQRDLLGDAS